MNREEFSTAIEAAVRQPFTSLKAEFYVRQLPGWSKPIHVECEHGIDCVIKHHRVGNHQARAAITDQVIARVAHAIGFPVAEPMLVEITEDLRSRQPQLTAYGTGIVHGTKFMPRLRDGELSQYSHLRQNRPRYAALAVLFGWAISDDEQVVYTIDPPELVYSLDHGFFLPESIGWNIEALTAAQAQEVSPFASIVDQCSLTNVDLSAAARILERLTDADVISAVAAPMPSWGISDPERLELAIFLARRRDAFVAAYR